MSRLAVLVFMALALAWDLPVRADTQPSEAERLFEQAQSHFAQGQYDQAVEFFERAFLLTQEPLLVYDIAQAYRRKGDCESALGQYRRYLQLTENPTPGIAHEEPRRFAQDRVTELNRQCGQPVRASPQERVAVQPETAVQTPLPPIRSPQKRGRRIFAIPLVLAGVGGGLLITGIYYMAVDGNEQCTTGETSPCVFHRETVHLGWAFLGAGAALLGSAVATALLEIRVTPAVAISVGPGSLRLRGLF